MRVAGPARVGRAAADAVPLAAVESPTVAALVRFMDRESDNFTAEMLLKEVGAVQGEAGTTADGLGVVAGLLTEAGVPLRGVRLVDGSGLSLLDRWTPAALVSLLRAMWNDPGVRPELLAALPVAGRTGTLADRMRERPGARLRPREDGLDRQRLRPLRVRRRPLRVLGRAERLAGRIDVVANARRTASRPCSRRPSARAQAGRGGPAR